jgi:hypothetical protein
VQDFLDDFRATLAAESARLLAMDENRASHKPAPGKWSPKEIVGHLIDSASNNHGRFVRAQQNEDMVFEPYDQDFWVSAQRYQDREWHDLVSLWNDLNTHIASVVAVISPECLSRQRTVHNLDRVGFRTVPRSSPVTLDYFVRDYLVHMKHHLAQIP